MSDVTYRDVAGHARPLVKSFCMMSLHAYYLAYDELESLSVLLLFIYFLLTVEKNNRGPQL